MSELILNINKVSYSGFESVHIRKSMLVICGGFAVSTDNFFQGGTSSQEIKMGHRVEIEINEERILSGWIDAMPIIFGRNFDRLEIRGRDNTCDLIDCCWDYAPNEWKNQSAKNLIKTFCAKFNIDVFIDASAQTEIENKLETFKANEGITISELILKICRDVGVLPISTGDGYLTLTKVTTSDYTDDPIIVGANAEGGELIQSNLDRYSSYKIKGSGIGTDNKQLSDFVECSGEFSDPIITRERPYLLFSENPSSSFLCRKRAVSEARVRAGLSRAVIYNVDSWVQSSGKPWMINKLVKVEDDFSGIEDTMLIAAIDYVYNENDGGDIAKIMCVDKNTFSLSEDEINIKTRFDV